MSWGGNRDVTEVWILEHSRRLYKLTYNDVMVGVAADDLFDLLSGSLSGRQNAVGVTVSVVQVQNIYSGIGP